MRLPLYSNKIENRFSKVIAVAAGKGGVGKSTIASTLAFKLRQEGKKVGILDADLYGPSIRKLVPAETQAYTEQARHNPAITKGLLSLSFADFKSSLKTNSMRAPLVDKWITEFTKNTNWGELDVLVIDCPPGTGDILLSLNQQIKIDYALIVTTPQELSLIDVRRTIKFFEAMNVPLLGIVENMSYLLVNKERIVLFGSGGGAALSQEFKMPLLANIPFNPKLAALSDKGFHIFESSDPDFEELKIEFGKIAKKIGFEKEIEPALALHGPNAFSITFADGDKRVYHLGDLQQNCPCANCQEKTAPYESDLKARGISTIGRYAIKIDFEKGCSNGIFPLKLLKTLGKPL
ncbi:MAG: P-loop NTPase [Parachlamydiaceae bacterium]